MTLHRAAPNPMGSSEGVAHRRTGIFHGWYVVATMCLCGFALYGAGIYAFIMFVTPLSDEFHWTRAATGSLVSAFFLSAPLSLASGRLVRRFGIRRLIATGVILEGASFVVLSHTSQFWELYALRALAGAGKVFYAITVPLALSGWFRKRFGMALAGVYAGWHLGGLVLAPLTDRLMHSLGWRGAAECLGLGLILIALPPALWVLRVPTAADAGLPLDGEACREKPARAVVSASAPQLPGTLVTPPYRTALRRLAHDPTYIMMLLGMIVFFLTYSGVLVHQAALIEGEGMASRTASLVLGATAGFAIPGAAIIGWTIDHRSMLASTVLQYALMAVGVACLLAFVKVPSTPLLVGHAVLFGLSIGGTDVFWIAFLKRRVSDELFPVAWSVWYFAELVTLVVAPVIAGHLYDLTGSYWSAMQWELLLLSIPIAVCLRVGRRSHPSVIKL